MKILVTGFEPFDGLSLNPSAQLLEHLEKENNKTPFAFELSTLLLPVSFNHAYTSIEEKALSFKPDIIIMTGLAQNRIDLTIEKIAVNYLNARNPDNMGIRPQNCKIDEDGPDGIFSTLPWEEIFAWAESERLPIKPSFTAGTYVCNDLFYKTMKFAHTNKIQSGFIHLPATEEINPLGPFFPKHELFSLFINLLNRISK
ncbi:MAG: pyroglutamyl-peptidase I [Bacteriovoracaceae bacterium]